MSTVALLLTLASALLHASRDLLIKCSVDKVVFSWLLRVLGVVLILPIALLRLHVDIPSSAWILIVASAIIQAFVGVTHHHRGDSVVL